MKKHLLTLISFSIFILVGQSQITLTADDLPDIGMTLFSARAAANAGITVGAPGANQTYDFSTLVPEDTVSAGFIDPAVTLGAAAFPTATLASEEDEGIIYFQETSSELLLLGLYTDTSQLNSGQFTAFPFDPPQKLFELPSTFNTSYTDTWGISLTIEDDSGFADSLRSTTTTERVVLFDGYGTVITPEGSFDGLRERIYSTTTNVFEAYIAGSWTPFTTSQNQDTSYYWYAKESRGPLVTVDIENGQATDITYAIVESTVVAPVAAFSVSGQGEGTFTFTDDSTNGPTSWMWDFGDGTTSTDQNPQHTFTTPGTYSVCLTVTNSRGSNTVCSDVQVILPPVAEFSFTGQGEGTFDFQDASSNDPESWMWDFGDGTTSTDQNPQHTFTTPGTYSVCLTVTNSQGSNTVCSDVQVILAPIAEFSFTDQGAGIFDFQDASGNDPESWMWDFGDGTISTDQNPQHTFTTPGTYSVCLTVTNSRGSNTTCSDVQVILAPIAEFSFTGQGEGTFDFQDASGNDPESWMWDFGDGTTSTDQNPQHTFTTPDTYSVCLTVTNSQGSNTTCSEVEVILAPIAEFSFTDQGEGTFDFQDASGNEPESWMWDFGDGTTSTDQNPQHTFTSSGIFNVCLTVTNGAGSNMICREVNAMVTSVGEIDHLIHLFLAPNPVRDQLSIRLDSDEFDQLFFRLIDPLGQVVLEEQIRTNESRRFDLSTFAAGIYYYVLSSRTGQLGDRGSILKVR